MFTNMHFECQSFKKNKAKPRLETKTEELLSKHANTGKEKPNFI